MMIVVRHGLKMRKGKIAARAGHASVEAALAALAREDRLTEAVDPITGCLPLY